MKEGQRLWTRDELILAINLYYKTPFGQMHSGNPSVVNLASLLNRTPGSIAYKLVNFASLDPSLKARGIKGASNVSKLDVAVWQEFYNNINELAFESERSLAEKEQINIEQLVDLPEPEVLKQGLTREAVVKLRVNQSFFRKSVLAAYNNTCCITGLQHPSLLVAGHIIPWSADEQNRLNPRNGLAMNALHDRAFENGLITITPDYRIKISPLLTKQVDLVIISYFHSYEGKMITLPSSFFPIRNF